MANPAILLTEKLREAASATEPLSFRQAPHNLEAEQALLGAILVNNEALDRVSGFLTPQHFFEPLHGRIFETLATLIHAGKTATPVTDTSCAGATFVRSLTFVLRMRIMNGMCS